MESLTKRTYHVGDRMSRLEDKAEELDHSVETTTFFKYMNKRSLVNYERSKSMNYECRSIPCQRYRKCLERNHRIKLPISRERHAHSCTRGIQSTNRQGQKGNSTCHITVKTLNTQGKESNLKAATEDQLTHKAPSE